MARLAILSDIHAGLGADDPGLRRLQTAAVRSAAGYLSHARFDTLVLNGDVTDHLANALAGGTSPEIAREVLAPLVSIIRARRGDLRTLLLAGNTDWPVADPRPEMRRVFFNTTGLSEEDCTIPEGGLLHEEDGGDATVLLTHGHAFKPAQWGHAGEMREEDYANLHAMLSAPTREFLEALSATGGSHRADYLKAVAVGSVVKLMPGPLRRAASDAIGGKFTAGYERHCAAFLAVRARATRTRVLGVMGHTHVAGIRAYGGTTVLNTGTAGAKPNPLQRQADPRGHLATIDTEAGTYELVRTYDAARPDAKPARAGGGTFADL